MTCIPSTVLFFKRSTSFTDGRTCVPTHGGFEIAKTVTWTYCHVSEYIEHLCKALFSSLGSCVRNVRQDDCLTAEQEMRPANNRTSEIAQSTQIGHYKPEYSTI